jgi:hypothetical protein
MCPLASTLLGWPHVFGKAPLILTIPTHISVLFFTDDGCLHLLTCRWKAVELKPYLILAT